MWCHLLANLCIKLIFLSSLYSLRKTLVSSIVGSLKDVRPAGWCLTSDYQQVLDTRNNDNKYDNEEWKPGLDYYVRLVGRLVRSLQVSMFTVIFIYNQLSI